MKILVACEYSGKVRDAFIKAGNKNTWSCDILPSESEYSQQHYQDTIESVLTKDPHWDLMVCHPPCTHLAVSGARWFKDKKVEQEEALELVRYLLGQDQIKHIALENPVSIISSRIRKASQYIQPWQFGHGETKKTGLWLKNLPLLEPTNIVEGRSNRMHMMPGGKNQAKKRSLTYDGIAEAMASQWLTYIRENNNE